MDHSMMNSTHCFKCNDDEGLLNITKICLRSGTKLNNII